MRLVVDDRPGVPADVVGASQGGAVEFVRNTAVGTRIAVGTPSGLQTALTADPGATIARIAAITAGAPAVTPLPELILDSAAALAADESTDRHLVVALGGPLEGSEAQLAEIAELVAANGITLHLFRAAGAQEPALTLIAEQSGGTAARVVRDARVLRHRHRRDLQPLPDHHHPDGAGRPRRRADDRRLAHHRPHRRRAAGGGVGRTGGGDRLVDDAGSARCGGWCRADDCCCRPRRGHGGTGTPTRQVVRRRERIDVRRDRGRAARSRWRSSSPCGWCCAGVVAGAIEGRIRSRRRKPKSDRGTDASATEPRPARDSLEIAVVSTTVSA